MNLNSVKEISLNTLTSGLPALSPGVALCFAEAGAVCFEDQGHKVGTQLKVNGSFCETFSISWPEVTEQMKYSWHDDEVATEHGAYGVAILLILELTDYTVVQRSRKGTGFDYWLGSKEASLFQNMARLEVSGIRNGSELQIANRNTIKVKQIDKTNTQLPGYVVVVEFGTPVSHVVEKNGC